MEPVGTEGRLCEIRGSQSRRACSGTPAVPPLAASVRLGVRGTSLFVITLVHTLCVTCRSSPWSRRWEVDPGLQVTSIRLGLRGGHPQGFVPAPFWSPKGMGQTKVMAPAPSRFLASYPRSAFQTLHLHLSHQSGTLHVIICVKRSPPLPSRLLPLTGGRKASLAAQIMSWEWSRQGNTEAVWLEDRVPFCLGTVRSSVIDPRTVRIQQNVWQEV